MVLTLHLLAISYGRGGIPSPHNNLQYQYQAGHNIYIGCGTTENIIGGNQDSPRHKQISDSLTHHNSENTGSEMRPSRQAGNNAYNNTFEVKKMGYTSINKVQILKVTLNQINSCRNSMEVGAHPSILYFRCQYKTS